MNPVEQHILKQEEPYQSMMLFIRDIIKSTLPKVEEKYSFRIPFYYYKTKPLVYLNRLKGTNFLDVSFLDGAILQDEFSQLKDYKKRKRARSLQFKTLETIDVELLKAVVLAGADLIETGDTTKYN